MVRADKRAYDQKWCDIWEAGLQPGEVLRTQSLIVEQRQSVMLVSVLCMPGYPRINGGNVVRRGLTRQVLHLLCWSS